MSGWSAWSAVQTPPNGSFDCYQSLQRLEPGAWVAAHTHEGPESGVVVSGTIARFEWDRIARFAPGETFATPAGVIHGTGNETTAPAEAITLHLVRAGSPFSTPCACADAPPAQPGASNPHRAIAHDCEPLLHPFRIAHARLTASDLPTIVDGDRIFVSVIGGAVRAASDVLAPGEAFAFQEPIELAAITDDLDILVARLQYERT